MSECFTTMDHVPLSAVEVKQLAESRDHPKAFKKVLNAPASWDPCPVVRRILPNRWKKACFLYSGGPKWIPIRSQMDARWTHMDTKWLPSGSQVVPKWIPGGSPVEHNGVPGGSQVDPSWFPSGSQEDSKCISNGCQVKP